jgi:acetyl esterase/lipase
MKIHIITLLLGVNMLQLSVQNPMIINIPVDSFVNADKTEGCEKDMGDGRIANITTPSLQVFIPKTSKKSDASILICPGGGYYLESFLHEGTEFAKWLSQRGITTFVLKYRLPNGNCRLPIEDAQKAIQLIRERSNDLKINPQKIGIMGFSAGGHLASTLLTHFNEKNRPNFGILFYPVITMEDSLTHKGSKKMLFGEKNDIKLVNSYSNEKHVTKDTPRTILFLCDDDKTVSPENSILFYDALKKNNIPASLYIFPEGGHGWGFQSSFKYHDQMKVMLLDWIDRLYPKD